MSLNVHAILRADINGKRHRRIQVPVESYSIDTAMDTDSDSWVVEIGDPGHDLVELLQRDNEIQVSLFAGRSNNLQDLGMGFCDEAGFTEEMTLRLSGRDITAAAVDSIAPPRNSRHVKPEKFVRKQAHSLGITNTHLARVKPLVEFYTDGSETYWESWYRMYRKRKMWLWAEPNGQLRADVLHYSDDPSYRFGIAEHKSNQNKWISVETYEHTSRKRDRVGEIMVIGQKSNIGLVATVSDPTISHWVRRPFKVVQDNDVRSRAEARQAAFEEIFEAKVGAIEIVITIPDPGFVIRQNKMARLRLPDKGIDDVFFVVGNEIIGGPGGDVQKIRLRQKGFAISRRVPDDPELVKPPSVSAASGLADALGVRWSDAFVQGAREFHGPWAFDLFLATMLAICETETGFRNVRYSGTTEWYPRPKSGKPTYHGGGAIEIWKRTFANARLNPLNPLYPRSEAAVGPMQLVTPGFKVWADEFGGKHGEYDGGRWVPEANIRAGCRAFAGKLAGLTVSDANIFYAAGFRWYGSGSASANQAYASKIKRLVQNKYLPQVKSALAASQEAGSGPEIKNAPQKVKGIINYLLKHLGDPYVWGAEGPNSFDCSGLAYAAYRSQGLGDNIGGRLSTYGYWNHGHGSGSLVRVYKNDLRPGDLLFFNSLTHMGVYWKDGMMIVAPHTGDVVKKQSITAQTWYGAMRLRGLWNDDPSGNVAAPHLPE